MRERLNAVPETLVNALETALVDDPPLLRRDGGFVREGYNPDLDAARALRNDSRKVMAELEARYIAETGIKALRIRHNNIFGFYIEVTQLNAKPLLSPPLSETFRHRQTMANAVRFATAELLETEGRIASASERALILEQEIFTDLAQTHRGRREHARRRGDSACRTRCLHGACASRTRAELCATAHRPELDAFEIRGGRHPVVQQALSKTEASAFIENDCVLGRDGFKRAAGI